MKFLILLALVAVVSVEGSEVVPDQLDGSELEQANLLEINGYEEEMISDGLNSVIERAGCTKASILCTLVGGKCIRKGDDCDGTYDPTACKGSRCACCVPHPIKYSRYTSCPIEEGFFMYSGQCFKSFTQKPDAGPDFFGANGTCTSNGLVLPHPYDAIGLRSYLVQRFGNWDSCWLNACGDGKYMRWVDNGKEIKESNPLWIDPPTDNVNYQYCLVMRWPRGVELKEERYEAYASVDVEFGLTNLLCELKFE